MSTQRYTPEFKEEAVRQVVERGDPVQQVAAREPLNNSLSHAKVSPIAG
jgi:transposase-like protein